MTQTKKKPYITVLIPAVNEEKLIKKIVLDVVKLKQYRIFQLVIIDSKTKDNTKTVAEKAGATVIHVGKGKGKGNAIKKAIKFCKGDFVVQIDADYQFLPSDIPALITPLQQNYDVTLGTRYQKGAIVEKGSVSPLKLFGSYLLSICTSIVAKQRITDVMAGFKGFKRSVLIDLNPKTDHFGYEAELVISAAQKRYKIICVPISYKKRDAGNSNVNSIKHGLLVLQTIFSVALRRN